MYLSYRIPDTMEILAMLLSLIEAAGPWVFLLLIVIAIAQQWVIHRKEKELNQERKTSEYYYQEYRKIRGTQHFNNADKLDG